MIYLHVIQELLILSYYSLRHHSRVKIQYCLEVLDSSLSHGLNNEAKITRYITEHQSYNRRNTTPINECSQYFQRQNDAKTKAKNTFPINFHPQKKNDLFHSANILQCIASKKTKITRYRTKK